MSLSDQSISLFHERRGQQHDQYDRDRRSGSDNIENNQIHPEVNVPPQAVQSDYHLSDMNENLTPSRAQSYGEEVSRTSRGQPGPRQGHQENGLNDRQRSYNFEHISLDIPAAFTSHAEASEVLGKAYDLVVQAHVYKTWAKKQRECAEENVNFTERQLEAAERQVDRAIEAIEDDGFRVFHDDLRSSRVPAVPYVVEIRHDICRLSVNGTDPVPCLLAYGVADSEN
ncbi:hypothetical protein HYPSUDRAFT_53902 [Hypholoma sublateritium FD-334 SS-4]|uniref:Uncharacterized protein n=1 Tax=Hypholoma sublateritium (strain FD-334 SS-4) TaxID=945553 RepID=A0A0D2L9Q9_HYPSF|nr:hypothetical protein HYPSUDRAFT_53902 [Hypholoma sublateritium FD-334 SS-4]